MVTTNIGTKGLVFIFHEIGGEGLACVRWCRSRMLSHCWRQNAIWWRTHAIISTDLLTQRLNLWCVRVQQFFPLRGKGGVKVVPQNVPFSGSIVGKVCCCEYKESKFSVRFPEINVPKSTIVFYIERSEHSKFPYLVNTSENDDQQGDRWANLFTRVVFECEVKILR